jgi:hypothetical protein
MHRCCFRASARNNASQYYSKHVVSSGGLVGSAHRALSSTPTPDQTCNAQHATRYDSIAHSSPFRLGDGHLEYNNVMMTMAGIIVFTVFCEQSLARTKRWITYYNPILHPCLDKVVSELMILGATAFSLVIFNELHEISGLAWYTTLHWIDNVIFIFALLYILCTIYILGLMGRLLTKLAVIDAIPSDELLERSRARWHGIHVPTIFGGESKTDSPSIPHDAANTILKAPQGHLYQSAEIKLHDFLTSEETELKLELGHSGCHKHIKQAVQPLQKHGLVTHTSTSGSNNNKILHIRKQPRDTWKLKPLQKKWQNREKTVKSVESGFSQSTLIYLHLAKYYFLSTVFPERHSVQAAENIDIVTYYEIAMSYGIIDCFNITFREWLYLFIVTVPVVKDVDLSGGLLIKNFHIFTVACLVLLLFSMLTTWWLTRISSKIIYDHYKIDDKPSSKKQAYTITSKKALAEVFNEFNKQQQGISSSQGAALSPQGPQGSAGSGRAKSDFFHRLMTHSHPLIEYSHGLTLANAKKLSLHHTRPKKNVVSLYGICLTEFKLRQFIQLQLLIQCFYLSIWICTFLAMYVEGKLSFFWMIAPLGIILVNLLFVTPWATFVGFGYVVPFSVLAMMAL